MSEERKLEIWEAFNAIGKDALSMSHYDLFEAIPQVSLKEWREFLNEPDVEDFVKKEMKLITDSIQKRIIADIPEGGDKSVGRAQLINSLDKLTGVETTKDGPTFIYTYVPLDKEQQQAENTMQLTRDPFKRRRE